MKKIATAVGLLAVLCLGQSKGDPEKGKETFRQCSTCHDPDSTDKLIGPGLQGLFKRATLKNGKKVTEANVKAVIDKGGSGMPPFEDSLSADEYANLMAYLKTL
jgi:cytochrome c